MNSKQLLISLCLCLFVTLMMTAATALADNCSITRKCSTFEETVYAVDKHRCYLFRNPCIFSLEQCRRKERKQKELSVVSKEECLKKCSDMCTEEYAPVCGEFNGSLKTFPNKCDFYRYSCKNNMSYMFVDNGACRA
ncbi:U-Kazal-Dg21.2 [Musca domestica]|uniref:Double-headed protease inhibitor, submandibular gland n=1 Tax=Musca domestica TaxID=7370 RepID=A0A1I8NHB9_MUSDO|nr:U-Kazal-Dg21.2 [Musca domestica]